MTAISNNKSLNSILKSIFLLYCFSLFSPNNFLLAQNNIETKIDTIVNDKFFERSIISIDVFNLTKNKSVYSLNQKLLLHPASNLKLFTSAAAMIFAKDFNFSTDIYYSGNIVDSVLNGNLFVVGNGDPNFTTFELDSLIKIIKYKGIKRIDGNLYGDVSLYDSLYWGKGWMWDDDPSSDAPYLTPLIINNSSIKVVTSPSQIGKSASVTLIPQTDFTKIINNSITVDEDSSDIKVSRGWISRDNNVTVSGQISNIAKPDTQEVNIYKPEFFFLKMFAAILNKNGIDFSGIIDTLSLPDSINHIITFQRKPEDVLSELNKESNNLTAESLLRLMAFQYYGKPATAENGIKVIDSLITILGFDPTDYRIVDGSGLSHYNLITTELVISLFKYLFVDKHKIFNLIYSSLPIAGVDGTLSERMAEESVLNNVRAKTGSLSGVSTLSGFVKNADNNLLAFSIFIQNFTGNADSAKSIQDKICKILAESN